MKGHELANLIYMWAYGKGIHPDDFDSLFAHELLEKLEKDIELPKEIETLLMDAEEVKEIKELKEEMDVLKKQNISLLKRIDKMIDGYQYDKLISANIVKTLMEEKERLENKVGQYKAELNSRFLQVTYLLDEKKDLETENTRLKKELKKFQWLKQAIEVCNDEKISPKELAEKLKGDFIK